MSLQLAAQHMASRGRGPDTQLVHMAPQEVAGLQALAKAHGGSLTVNPETGLAEAGFLKNILPTLIGAGLMFATGGAAAPGLFGLSKAATIGLGIGGLQTARTGSLAKGLMAGLGAYGGAGLTGALMGAGAAGATGAGTQAIDATMTKALPVSSGAITPTAGLGGQTFAQASQAANAAATNQAINTAMTNALPLSSGAGLVPTVTPAATSAATTAAKTAATTPGLMKYGLAAAAPMLDTQQKQTTYDGGGPNPYEFDYDQASQRYTRVPIGTRQRDIFSPMTPMTTMADGGPVAEMSDRNEALTLMANNGQMFAAGGQVNLTGTFTAGGPGAGTPNTPQGMQQTMQPPQTPASMFDFRAIAANPQGFAQHMAQMQQREQQMPGSTMLGSGMQKDMRATAPAQPRSGGLGGMAAGFLGGGGPSYEQYAAENERRLAERRNPNNMIATHDYIGPTMSRADFEASLNRPRNSASSFAAGGGVSHLGDYSDGGRLLRGPGDGVSDSIPATIANKRPARLADGEFVVPARIVSELGNGSTEAGARKLYAMMDRIQKARGKTTGKNRVAVNSKAERMLPA